MRTPRKSRIELLLAALAALAPGWAGAVDLDYYTYNAFEETVAAFQRVSLVLQDPGFSVFVLIFAVTGVLVGGLVVGARGMQGRQINPIAFLVPVVVGVALFRGFVWPTGNLFIYDPVRNATSVVADVPDAVVLLAGALNKIERGVNEIVRTASADPDAERSGALRYSLILNALNARGTDINLERNLVNYYLDCGLPSMSLGFNGASTREAERDTADLYDTFARFAHPSFSTFAFTGAGDATTTMTCSAMWTTVLAQALSGANALEDVRNTICTKSGFDIGSAPQIIRCDDELRSLGSLYGLTSTSPLPFVRSTQMAIAMTNALRSGDISVQSGAIVNRQVMAEGMGVAEALDRWVPKVRGFMTAAVLGMVPLALLFVVTPLLGKALQLLAGLFLWLALWGVADAISVSMAADAAADSFSQMTQYGFSHLAFMLSPEGAIQSLGVFGKARAMALMMATVLSYALFQFGGYAFTNMANSWQNDVQNMGEAAGKTALFPEERAAMMQRMATSPAAEATLNQYGFAAVAGGATVGGAQQASEARRVASYISPRLTGSPEMEPSLSGQGTHHEAPNTSAMETKRGQTRNGVPDDRTPDSSTGEVNEIVVTGHAPSRSSRASNLFDAYVDPKTDDQVGKTIGAIEARTDVAQRGERGIFEVSREVAAFAEEQSVVSTLTEKDVLTPLGHDASSSGFQAGQLSAGRTAAQTEIRSNIAGNQDAAPTGAEVALQMGRQERAEVIGATQAASTQRFVDAAEQRTRRSIAEGEQMSKDESAERIGRVDAKGAEVGAVAFERTEQAFGKGPMVEGATFNRMTDAARGAEVSDSDNPADIARRLAHVDVAERVAHAEVFDSVGRLIGVDTSSDSGAQRLATAKEGASQMVTIPATREGKEYLIEALGLDEQTANALRAHSGGLKLSMALDEHGSLVYSAITGGEQTSLVDSTSIERGFTERADYAYSVSGGRALVLETEYLTNELNNVYGDGLLAGRYDETRAIALAGALSKYMAESGHSIDASSQEAVAYSIGGALGGGAAKLPIGSIRGSVSRQETDVRNARSDLTFEYALEVIREAHSQAMAGFQIDHGSEPNENAREELLHRMVGSIQKSLADLDAQVIAETRGAQHGHDVDLFPYNELPAAPMSDPEYARDAPINRR